MPQPPWYLQHPGNFWTTARQNACSMPAVQPNRGCPIFPAVAGGRRRGAAARRLCLLPTTALRAPAADALYASWLRAVRARQALHLASAIRTHGATHPQSRLCGRKICASPAAAHCVSTVALPGTRPECQPRFASSSPRLPFGLARLSATSSLVGQPQTSACSSSWVLRRVRRRSGCLWSAATATRLLSRARAPSRALTLHHLTRPDLKASICHTALKRCPTALLQSAAPACRCTARCSAHSLACCGSSSRFIQTTAAT